MTAQPTPEQARLELKRACLRAYAEFRHRNFTSGKVAGGSGLTASVVRKLGADGDQQAWRVPTPHTCARIDEFCRIRDLPDFRLSELRERLDKSGWRRPTDKSRQGGAAVPPYLTELLRVMSAAPNWMPFTQIGEGFQDRTLYASYLVPAPAEDDEVSGVRIPRGDVPWSNALLGAKIAVVIADAGFGKSWQTRRHAAQLAEDALADPDPDAGCPVPLWLHAAELADGWPGSDPVELLVDVATAPIRQAGIDTRGMQDDLATLVKDGEVPVTFLIDAYDEVIGDGHRAAIRQALTWLASYVRERAGYQVLLTSRAAGYDDPFDDDGDDEPLYLYLGGLAEVQIRRLWQGWFDRRGEPLPHRRLEAVLAPGSALRQFAHVPLIAAFCAWVAEVETVGQTRAQLFDQVVQRFLARAWKRDEPSVAGNLTSRDDGARRASMAAALAELAWTMGCAGQWNDTIEIASCETVLKQHGLSPVAGHSLTFEAVRGIGVLVQPAAIGSSTLLGDGLVSWIHRSVHEFLAARHLLTMDPEVVRGVVDRAWLSAPLTGVLDFALGLASDGGSRQGPVRPSIDEFIASDRDALGYYTLMVAASEAGTAADAQRLWSLSQAGLISPESAASALARSGYADNQEDLVELLLQARNAARRGVFDALAWCGQPGRAALADIVAHDQDADGASAALHRVDPESAVAAVQARIQAGLPVGAADEACLREAGRDAVALLRTAAEDRPASAVDATALGLSHRPEALATLRKHLAHSDPAVRHAALLGISSWYGYALDADGCALLLRVALEDDDPNLRVTAREILTRIGLSLPWVDRAANDVFEYLHDSTTHSPMIDLASLAERLWPVGPATHKVVVMLSLDPMFLDPQMNEPLAKLRESGLAGELEPDLTKDLADLLKTGFTDPARAVLSRSALTGAQLDNLAGGLAMAVPDDPELFGLLVQAVGRQRSLILDGISRNYNLPADDRVRVVTAAVLALDSFDDTRIRVWVELLRQLLYAMPFQQRRTVRDDCQAATRHVVGLHRQHHR
jgi:hypothetical protein